MFFLPQKDTGADLSEAVRDVGQQHQEVTRKEVAEKGAGRR